MGLYLVTGGATGIGAAIKNQLIKEAHKVLVVDIKDVDIQADLSSGSGRQAAIDEIRKRAPEGLNGIITCAGVASHTPNHALIASLNFFGSTELISGLKDLLAMKKGSAIVISSNSAPMPTNDDYVQKLLDANESEACNMAETMDGHAVYSGSKQALARWMRTNTPEYARDGIRLNAIAPGYTQTPMTKAVEEDKTYGAAIKEFVASIPIGRPGQAQDMADTVSFLLKPEAAFICGSVIFIDGGHDAMMRPHEF